MTLSIILAGRGRPALIERTIAKTLENIALPDTQFVIALDHDDPDTAEAARKFVPRVEVAVWPREDSLGGKFNRVLSIAPADVYLYMVDYAPIVTRGFDKVIIDAADKFKDGIGFVFTPLANLSFPYYQAVTDRTATIMGEFFPEHFPYWFIDHWSSDIARMIGRIAFADIKVDVTRRPGTQDKRDPAFWATLYDALRQERHAIANSLLECMDIREWHKEILRAQWPLIDQRSEMINDGVRTNAAYMAQVPSDDRYERIKARAVQKMRDLMAQHQQAAA